MNEKELLEKAGLDSSWTVASVGQSTWQGVDSKGQRVPIRSTKVQFTKESNRTVEFTETV